MSSREVEWSVYYLPASHMPLLPSPGLLAGQSIPPQMASLFLGTFVSMLKLSISVDLSNSVYVWLGRGCLSAGVPLRAAARFILGDSN